jgi:hypothetical protein
MQLILAVALAVLAMPAAALEAATPAQFDSHVVHDPALGDIGWHIDNLNPEEKGPLVVWLPGSGAFPHFQRFSDGSQGTSFPRDLFAFRDRAHFLLVDKPGIPFSADMRLDEATGRPVQLDGPIYRAGLARDNLIARTVKAIAAARRTLGARVDQVVIMGGHADKAMGWGGLALPQYHDFIIEQRLRAERGEITRAEAQAAVEEVFAAIKAIHANPLGLEQQFMGETNRRWSGFGAHAVVDDMLALKIPLLLVQGGDDDKAPIINTDFAMVAFLSRGRSNLDYWVYPEADHGMRVTDPARPGKRISIAPEIWTRVWAWVTKQP